MSAISTPWVVGLQAGVASAEDRDRFVRQIKPAAPDHTDWILLSTCHRAELYGFGLPPNLCTDLPTQAGVLAVKHLFRVAAGLESAIVGEDEVLHQVREALAMARRSRAIDPRLGRMFETAIAVGRLARASRSAVAGSLAQRAIEWLRQRTEITARPLLVVGAGRMGSVLAHAARRVGSEVTIASRSHARAAQLARVYGATSLGLGDAAEVAPRFAAIAVALAGEWMELRPSDRILPPIADISAPSALPTPIRERLDGRFLGIDDLYRHAPGLPTAYVDRALQIVDAKTGEFERWLDRLT